MTTQLFCWSAIDGVMMLDWAADQQLLFHQGMQIIREVYYG
jgi:hypothetical protein